eukprot:TRINITY_DN1760_c0_g1_i1.p1 TRINITY_DN1760_c0_g1~~TRINITY_DN1760_c0_g1_i1.p1  ORF type:complete len:995 (+),score=192.08 TRINITY_DN1760_c0_g1_i1:71-3055(+)
MNTNIASYDNLGSSPSVVENRSRPTSRIDQYSSLKFTKIQQPVSNSSIYSILPPPLPVLIKPKLQRSKTPQLGIPRAFIFPGPTHIQWLTDKTCDCIEPASKIEMQRLDDSRPYRDCINRIVYDSIEYPEGPPNPLIGELKPWYIPVGQADSTLIFESRFESGNLRRAIQVTMDEYDLILSPDTNTNGHTQWFYFSVSNLRKDRTYKFNIINLTKADSLYNKGMQPVVYSEYLAKKKVGWQRAGTDVCYFPNRQKRKHGHYMTLTFSYTALADNDTVYFAHCFPYTYTILQMYLNTLENDPVRSKTFRRKVLCKTVAGNNVDMLTITSYSSDISELRERKGVVISARVHPGETNSSWIMKGIIDYITGDTIDAKILRDNFVFKIIPMLNPDGVVLGNYRCNLAGYDLNRTWANPSAKLHPVIWNMKLLLRSFLSDREVIMYLDLHGHSNRKNIFIYGCENKASELVDQEKIFPMLLDGNSHAFSFSDCSFKVHKAKLSTGRVIGRREFGMVNSFTMEASFCGANFGLYKDIQFSTDHLEEMGHCFCDSLLDYCDSDQMKVKKCFSELKRMRFEQQMALLNESMKDEETSKLKSSKNSKNKENFSTNNQKKFSTALTNLESEYLSLSLTTAVDALVVDDDPSDDESDSDADTMEVKETQKKKKKKKKKKKRIGSSKKSKDKIKKISNSKRTLGVISNSSMKTCKNGDVPLEIVADFDSDLDTDVSIDSIENDLSLSYISGNDCTTPILKPKIDELKHVQLSPTKDLFGSFQRVDSFLGLEKLEKPQKLHQHLKDQIHEKAHSVNTNVAMFNLTLDSIKRANIIREKDIRQNPSLDTKSLSSRSDSSFSPFKKHKSAKKVKRSSSFQGSVSKHPNSLRNKSAKSNRIRSATLLSQAFMNQRMKQTDDAVMSGIDAKKLLANPNDASKTLKVLKPTVYPADTFFSNINIPLSRFVRSDSNVSSGSNISLNSPTAIPSTKFRKVVNKKSARTGPVSHL